MKMRVLVVSLLVAGALADCSTVDCASLDNLTDIFSDSAGADTPGTVQTCCKPAVESAGWKAGSSGAVAVTVPTGLEVGDDGVPTGCTTGYTGSSPYATISRDSVKLCTDLTDNTAVVDGNAVVTTSDWTTGTWNSQCGQDVADVFPVCEEWVSGSGGSSASCGRLENEPWRWELLAPSVANSEGGWESRGVASSDVNDKVSASLFNSEGELSGTEAVEWTVDLQVDYSVFASAIYLTSNTGLNCVECITGYQLNSNICSQCAVTGAATYGANSYPNSGSNVECAVATCLAGYEKITDNDPVTCDSCGSPAGYDAARGETSVGANNGLGGWRNPGVDCTIHCDASNFYYQTDNTNLGCSQCSGTTDWAPTGWSESGGTCTVTACATGSEAEPNTDGTACVACANQSSSASVATVADNTCAFTCAEGWEKTTDTTTCTACDSGLTPSSTGVVSVNPSCVATCEEGYYDSSVTGETGQACSACQSAGPYSASDSTLSSANAGVTSVSSSCQITAASGYHVEGTDTSAENYADNTVVANTAATVTWNDGCAAGTDYTNKSSGDAYPSFSCCTDVSSANSDPAIWVVKAEFASPNTFLVTSYTEGQDYTLALGTVCERKVCLDTELGGVVSNQCTSVGTARQRRNSTAQYADYNPELNDSDFFASVNSPLTSAEQEAEHYNNLLEPVPWTSAPAGVIYGGTNYKHNGLRSDGTWSKLYTDSACWGCDLEYGFIPYAEHIAPAQCYSDINGPAWRTFSIDVNGSQVQQGPAWYGECMDSDQWFRLSDAGTPFECADDEAEVNAWDCLPRTSTYARAPESWQWGCSGDAFDFTLVAAAAWPGSGTNGSVHDCKQLGIDGVKYWAQKYMTMGGLGVTELWEAREDTSKCPAGNKAHGLCGTDRMASTSCVSEFSGTCEGSDTPDTCTAYGKERCTAVSGCSWTGAVWSTDNTAGGNQTQEQWYAACSAACDDYFQDLIDIAEASCDAQETARAWLASAGAQSLMEYAALLGSLTSDGGPTIQQAVNFFNSRDGDLYNFADEGAPIQKNHGKIAGMNLIAPGNLSKVRGMANRADFGFTDAVMDALDVLATEGPNENSPASALYTLLALAAAAVLAL